MHLPIFRNRLLAYSRSFSVSLCLVSSATRRAFVFSETFSSMATVLLANAIAIVLQHLQNPTVGFETHRLAPHLGTALVET